MVWVCFNSFLAILDFLDFCEPLRAPQKSPKYRADLVVFWRNVEIPETFRQFYIDPKREEKAVVWGYARIEKFQNRSKCVQTTLNYHRNSYGAVPVPPETIM